MPRYRFAVEYMGTRFAGWQVQPGAPTVQAELERALAVCVREPIRIIGSGRTDAGVHARCQVVHFDCEHELESRRVEGSLNALTGWDICVRGMEPCALDFHARYSALSRYYRYRIALRPTALDAASSWYPGTSLDVGALSSELAKVEGRHDFVNFSIPRHDGKPTECTMLRAEVVADGLFLVIHLEADRFLHKMVRSIVGACYDVARGRHAPGLVPAILAGDFSEERTWAPPHGLVLERVRYDDYAP